MADIVKFLNAVKHKTTISHFLKLIFMMVCKKRVITGNKKMFFFDIFKYILRS